MKLLSHVHINSDNCGNEWKYARIMCDYARKRGYSHIALGCHNWTCPADLMVAMESEYGVKTIRCGELDAFIEYPSRTFRTTQFLAYNLENYDWFHPFDPLEETVAKVHQMGGRAVLAHPENRELVEMVHDYFDGCELYNGIGPKFFPFVLQYPNLVPFFGADWHIYEGLGDPNITTALPDDWFGEIKP